MELLFLDESGDNGLAEGSSKYYILAGISFEDVVFRDSKASYFIQMADILAFSINRIITGRGKQDDFAINPLVIKKLKSKIEQKNFIT